MAELKKIILTFTIVLISCFKLVISEHAIACEDRFINMSCSEGTIIEIVSASYGRKSRKFCNFGAVSDINCAAAGSLAIVKGICGRQCICNAHSSYKVFGDPCVGTNKYLEVEYKCVKDAETFDKMANGLNSYEKRLDDIETYIYGKPIADLQSQSHSQSKSG